MSKGRTLKRKVRARMAQTGESYCVARNAILAEKAKEKAPVHILQKLDGSEGRRDE